MHWILDILLGVLDILTMCWCAADDDPPRRRKKKTADSRRHSKP